MKKSDIECIKHRLPKQHTLSGEDEYKRAAVLVLLLEVNGEPHIVFEERCEEINQGGEICLPGGRIDDADEGAEAAALRETEEELGLCRADITIIGRLNTVVSNMGSLIEVMVGTADTPLDRMKINHKEVKRIFSLPVAFFCSSKPKQYSVQLRSYPTWYDRRHKTESTLLPAKELGLPKRYHRPWGEYRPRVLVYETQEGVIWGITARIINDFVQYMKEEKDS